ncbi:hypothetical protein [Labrys neptuniae]
MHQPDDPGIDPDFDLLAEPFVGGNRVVAFCVVVIIVLAVGVLAGIATWALRT